MSKGAWHGVLSSQESLRDAETPSGDEKKGQHAEAASNRERIPVRYSDDFLRGRHRGAGMAGPRVRVPGNYTSRGAGWPAVARRDEGGKRVDHARFPHPRLPGSETASGGLRAGAPVVGGPLDHRWSARLRG